MPNGRRIFVPGVSLHVRQRGNNRCAIFGDDRDYESFLVMLESAARRYRVGVHGYALMTTHTHLLLTPSTETGTAKTMQQARRAVCAVFQPEVSDALERSGPAAIRAKPITDERYWLTCLRYIEQNPVRAKLVVRPGAIPVVKLSARMRLASILLPGSTSHPVFDALGADNARTSGRIQGNLRRPVALRRDRSASNSRIRVRPGSDPGLTRSDPRSRGLQQAPASRPAAAPTSRAS